MKVYVLTMNRWGDPELHSYVGGVFQSEDDAKAAGQVEYESRDHKYEPYIEEFELIYEDKPWPEDDFE